MLQFRVKEQVIKFNSLASQEQLKIYGEHIFCYLKYLNIPLIISVGIASVYNKYEMFLPLLI